MPDLFSSLQLRSITLPNRIAVSPMCQYTCVDGHMNDWHLVHLGSRAVGGAGLVLTEATAVSPEGRISPQDAGIWSDDHVPMLRRITDFIHSQGILAGIQLAHAGRKASTPRNWDGTGTLPELAGGWKPIAPSAIAFAPDHATPEAMTKADIRRVVDSFASATRRAKDAGFDVVEVHSAHGYLLHEFLSPLSNQREDEFGGSMENRFRALLETVDAVRAEWPASLPVFVRISATDWVDGGWDADQSVALAKVLRTRGVDLVDCSSGGLVADAKIPWGPGFQVPFAERIRSEAGIATGAVGFITEPAQATGVIESGKADLVLLAREMLRDPYWPVHAAERLGKQGSWPVQYLRAAPQGASRR